MHRHRELDWLLVQIPGSGGGRGGSWEALRDLAFVNTNTCGHHTVRSVGTMAAVLTSVSSVVEAARFLYRAGDCEP